MSSELDKLKQALILDQEGNWDGAHAIVQKIASSTASWIHAYLHRKEGDKGNAGYWYQRADKIMPDYDLEREWKELYEYLQNL